MALPPIVVMHVEDEPGLAAAVAGLLSAHGYEMLTASDGRAALAALRHCRAPPDVLILDFNLPGDMNGTDVAEEVCRVVRHVLPTIFLSGELSNAALPWLPGAPLMFAAKPLDADVLLQTVAAFAALGRFIRHRAHR